MNFVFKIRLKIIIYETFVVMLKVDIEEVVPNSRIRFCKVILKQVRKNARGNNQDVSMEDNYHGSF